MTPTTTETMLLEALEALVEHTSMSAMDNLIEQDSKIIGWEKTPKFSRLLDNARRAIATAKGEDRQ